MSLVFSDRWPLWMMTLVLVAHLLAGGGLGLLYFHALRHNVELLIGGRRVLLPAMLMAGRFALTAAVLVLAAREGAPPLLAVAAGFAIGRQVVLRRNREAAA